MSKETITEQPTGVKPPINVRDAVAGLQVIIEQRQIFETAVLHIAGMSAQEARRSSFARNVWDIAESAIERAKGVA